MKKRIFSILIYTAAGLLAAALLWKFFAPILPELWTTLCDGDAEELEDILSKGSQIYGLLCLALMQVIQVISIVLASLPIHVAGGMVFGIWKGFVVCHLSNVLGNVLVFSTVRHFRIPHKSGDEKFNRAMKLLERGDSRLMITMACMAPIVPNGIIPHAAARMKITTKQFAFGVWVGSAAPTFLMCAVGRRLLTGDYVAAAALFFTNLLLMFVVYRYAERITSYLEQRIFQRQKSLLQHLKMRSKR